MDACIKKKLEERNNRIIKAVIKRQKIYARVQLH